MKILHVLYQSIPNAKGSSIRSRDLIDYQQHCGLEPVVVSSPFQPPLAAGQEKELINGVVYYRTFNGRSDELVSEETRSVWRRLRKFFQLFTFARRVRQIALLESVDVIHAHATFFCGMAGWYAARRLGIPFVYEVRSLWEERAKMANPTLKERLISGGIRRVETFVMSAANAVVCINESLRQDVVARGIPPGQTCVVGNAVGDQIASEQQARSWTGARRDELVFAYIGSISPIEGLDVLLDAWAALERQGIRNKLLLYGAGPALGALQTQAGEMGLTNVDFKGTFGQEQAPLIYEGVDVIINPRRKSRLSDTVTPLKPLEAMAYKKLLVVSDVGGMNELVADCPQVLLVAADDAASIAAVVERVIGLARNQLAAEVDGAWRFVLAHRTWSANAKLYKRLYEELAQV